MCQEEKISKITKIRIKIGVQNHSFASDHDRRDSDLHYLSTAKIVELR